MEVAVLSPVPVYVPPSCRRIAEPQTPRSLAYERLMFDTAKLTAFVQA